jgi:HAD superfamily hydrolase (TIGR01549 family)
VPTGPQTGRRWVCLDVGETLIDETRIWSTWADVLEIPRLTFMAAFGAAVARGGDHRDVARMLDRPDWLEHGAEVERRYGGFTRDDLYPDALPTLERLRELGYRLAILANQPAQRTAELTALGVRADVMAMSGELGIHKPALEFFSRAADLMSAEPADIAYVGDRLDNDVRPAAAAGMRAVWLRRGAWGVIVRGDPPPGTLVVGSLTEFVERIGEVWP